MTQHKSHFVARLSQPDIYTCVYRQCKVYLLVHMVIHVKYMFIHSDRDTFSHGSNMAPTTVLV